MIAPDLAAALQVLRHEPDRARVDFGLDLLLSMLTTARAPQPAAAWVASITPPAPPAAAPEPAAPAEPGMPRPRQHDDLLRRLWLENVATADIAARIGGGMTAKAVWRRVKRLGLPDRPPVFSAEGKARLAARIRTATGIWTEAREATLQRLWAENARAEAIRAALNELPGPRITSDSTIFYTARRLGLPPRPGFATAAAERMRATRAETLAAQRTWTEERNALLLQVGGIGKWEAALTALQALPGPPIRSVAGVKAQFYTLRRTQNGQPTPEPQPIAAAPEPAPQPQPEASPPPAPPSSARTEARAQLLRDLWRDPAISITDLLDRINALPGPPFPMTARLYDWAKQMGLPTPRPAAANAPPAPRRIEPDPLTPREQARAALREGRSERVILTHIAIHPDDLRDLIAEEAALADQRADARRAKALDMIRRGEADATISDRTGFKLRDLIRFRAELREEARAERAA